MTSTVDFDIVRVGSVKSMIFGGEGVFFARLRGPGTVWLQSLPFSRLAGRILANAGPVGGREQGLFNSFGSFGGGSGDGGSADSGGDGGGGSD